MKQRKVVIPPSVQDQITEQVLYIAEDSIDNALAWEDRLRAAILSLATNADYAVDEDASERIGVEIRRLVFERNYLVHYRVYGDEVSVLNFRHTARLPRRSEP